MPGLELQELVMLEMPYCPPEAYLARVSLFS
jgi:hypothetical protein